MGSIEHFSAFHARAFGILRSLLPKAERVDLATDAFTLRQWLDLDPRLTAFVEAGGQLRVLVWPGGLSPAALDALCRLENTQVALA
ncbi:MAG: hypothetical protein HYS12_21830 [Planctomycetes bacterium]|nr:hypothetical protein [Planctomycetota bacterium]